MWRPPINFITLHYAYIVSYGIMAMAILYPAGNLRAVDAYFFGVSASTESGLNPVDVKDLKLYQQFFLYFVPIVTNMGFVNIIVVIIRLRYFSQRFKKFANKRTRITRPNSAAQGRKSVDLPNARDLEQGLTGETVQPSSDEKEKSAVDVDQTVKDPAPRITFAPEPRRDEDSKYPLHIPGPRERENGQPIVPLSDNEEDEIKPVNTTAEGSEAMRRRRLDTVKMSKATSIDRAMSSVFVLGSTSGRLSRTTSRASRVSIDLSSLSPEELGGIEYRALRNLLKITIGYYFSLHFFGILCLVPWIHRAPHKYQEYLGSQGIDKTWWGFYSAQTMVNNLGFTLTPDSMISFRDATWPMLVLSFLAYAGHTFYPVFLRLVIWTIYKIVPEESSMKESLLFLLDHPRRCYTLLFPSVATWTLAGILVALNFVDVLLIVCLDLDNPEVNVLPVGPRILASIFQAASSRHTGTASFNLGNVNPAVQFSLLVMMYISIYPIAISVRMSTEYEERPVAIFPSEGHSIDEAKGSGSYLINHMRNQLSFDLWYIFLGVFCICCAESKRIMNRDDYAFSVFSIFFEVVSAYANVGLSLGYPTNLTSLCGHFTVFSKLTICAMMIRGRHRGLPYAIDRAIMLPIDRRNPDYDYLNRTRSKEEQKIEPERNSCDQDNTSGSKSKET